MTREIVEALRLASSDIESDDRAVTFPPNDSLDFSRTVQRMCCGGTVSPGDMGSLVRYIADMMEE